MKNKEQKTKNKIQNKNQNKNENIDKHKQTYYSRINTKT